MDHIRCKEHPTAELISDWRAGDLICPRCGVVVGERVVDVSTEWRSFNAPYGTKDPSRVGAAENPLLSGSELGTSIIVNEPNHSARHLQRMTMNAQDHQLTTAFNAIKDMADRKNIPSSVVEQAKLVYKNGFDSGALKNKSMDSGAAASLYIACRKGDVPRTFKEIAVLSGISVKEVGKTYKAIINNSKSMDMGIVSAIDHVNRFVNNIALPRDVRAEVSTLASRIIKRAMELDICTGRSPISVAAAGIYLACIKLGIHKTPKDVGDACGAAEATVKQTCSLMQSKIDKLTPSDDGPGTSAKKRRTIAYW